MKRKLIAICGGLAGACTVSLLHQAFRYAIPAKAPRMDLMGMEAMRKTREHIGMPVPPEHKLYKQTFIGDIAANTLYYSLVAGDYPKFNGWLLGAGAGLGAVNLPKHVGLDPANSNRTEATQYITVGLYIAGGLAAAATVKWLSKITKN